MRPFPVVVVGFCLLSGGPLRPGPTAAAPPEKKAGEKALAEVVAKDWAPKRVRAGESQGTGSSAPKDGPTRTTVSVFATTMATYPELYDHYAEKCGSDTRYGEKNFYIGSGDGKDGSFMIVDRVPGAGPRETIFSLRAKEYTVTVTIHPAPDGKAVLGTVAVTTH